MEELKRFGYSSVENLFNMRDHRSERSEVCDFENERPRQQSASGLRELLRGPRVPAFVGNAKGLKDWIA